LVYVLVRMVRWLILLAVGVAGAAQAQAAAISNDDAGAGAASRPAAQVEVPGLQPVRGMRASPRLREHLLPGDSISTFVQGDQIDGSPDTAFTLTGHAQIRRPDAVLKGDRIHYDRKTGEVTVDGNLRVLRDATLITGPSGRINLDDDEGEINAPDFWLGATGGTAQAQHADIFSQSEFRLTQVRYSGCSCSDPSWYIKADSLDVDMDENEGVARNGVLYFKGVPILASPHLTFPVKDERKSGFLMPTYSASSRTGFTLAVPYYLNLAPNYDLTLDPQLMSKRGMMLGATGRYLGDGYTGLTQLNYLPSDREAHRDRWMYRWTHYQRFDGGFYANWDIQRVSDNNYYRDINNTIGLNTASTVYLPQTITAGWLNTYWNASVQSLHYQTLQDPAAPVAPPFNELAARVNGHRYDWNGFDVNMDASAVRFTRPLQLGTRLSPDGNRFQIYPSVSYPIVHPGWYITPKIGVNYTQYGNTNWYNTDFNQLGGLSSYGTSASRTVPILSLDTGMTFDRQTSLFGRSATQTLEPRLYYLYIPYRNQNNLPVYDTYLAPFSFDQAFQENRYVGGWDRINNANQLTAAVTTRWIDNATGLERFSLSGGIQQYFVDQMVTLPGEVARTHQHSDLLGGASAALTDTLSTDLGVQYDAYGHRVSQAYTSLRWSPQRLTTVALTYRYQSNALINQQYLPTPQNQISLGVQWPFSKHWYGVGRIDYALGQEATGGNSRFPQAMLGVEYKSDCCWSARVVFQRYAISGSQANTALFFQLELTGLGSLGSDPMDLINRNIPGYQPVTPAPQPGSSFERYE
jgi:LPS-assembly protein